MTRAKAFGSGRQSGQPGCSPDHLDAPAQFLLPEFAHQLHRPGVGETLGEAGKRTVGLVSASLHSMSWDALVAVEDAVVVDSWGA